VRQGSRVDGGGERIVDRMHAILTKQGHDVTLISRAVRSDSVRVLVCDPPAFGRIGREQKFAQQALKSAAAERFDIVQSHERIPGCTVYRAGDGVHATWLEQRRRVMNPFTRTFLAWQPYHRYVLQAERQLFEHPGLRAVICNSRMVQQDILRRFAIKPEKLHLIYNGIDPVRFHPRLKQHRAAIRRLYGIPDDTPVFLFVGSGWERKGLAAAIRAVAQVPRAQLLVVGRDKKQSCFQRMATTLHAADRIHFAGVQADVGQYLGAADAFLLPPLYDPFPNAILEAMAAGLPVITSTTCGAAEVIQAGEHGYVCDALDQAALTEAISRLADQTLAAEMGKRARAVIEPFTVLRMERELTQLYHQLSGHTADDCR